jgi:hypothetical protein
MAVKSVRRRRHFNSTSSFLFLFFQPWQAAAGAHSWRERRRRRNRTIRLAAAVPVTVPVASGWPMPPVFNITRTHIPLAISRRQTQQRLVRFLRPPSPLVTR